MMLLLLGCRSSADAPPPVTQSGPAPAALMGAIVAANVAWGDALVRGDSLRLMNAYTSGAVLLTDSGDVSSPARIRDWLLARRAALQDSLHGTRTNTDHLEVATDRAYEAGTLAYILIRRDHPGQRREHVVRYATFWHRSPDGRWLMDKSLRPLP